MLTATNRRKISVTLIIAFVVIVASIVSAGTLETSSRKHDSYNFGALSSLIPAATTAISASGQEGQQNALANLSNREIIVQYIALNPGLYLRELSEDLGLPMGVIQYHIWSLVKEGQVEDYRDSRYRRFFATAANYQMVEKRIISLLRQETVGKILVLLSRGTPVSHKELAIMLGFTSQAVSWHMSRLHTTGFIKTCLQNFGKSYLLREDIPTVVAKYLRI